MSVLVAGTIAIDSIETPTEKRDNLLGGSASYAAVSASYFSPVQLVGIVGKDFPDEHFAIFRDRNIDIGGVEVADGETFRWTGRYFDDMNERETLKVALNVIEHYEPRLADTHRNSRVALLANMAPQTQNVVLDQLSDGAFVIADSMDLWINIARVSLLELLKRLDLFVINESEAKLFTETGNLITAGHKLRALGPKNVVIKKGEHGAMLFGDGHFFSTVAYPLHTVHDPTGAGDSFAGGIAGFLSSLRKDTFDFADISRSVVYGTVMASYNCESFSADRLRALSQQDIDRRYGEFRSYTAF